MNNVVSFQPFYLFYKLKDSLIIYMRVFYVNIFFLVF